MWYETDKDGFIASISAFDDGGYEISEERATAIRESFRNCPADTETNTYRLNSSVEWVAVPKDDEPTAEEILAILLGEGDEE